jgi:hypothetical protein
LARLAIILREGSLTKQQVRLGRILDFFGIPWEAREVSNIADGTRNALGHVVFGSAQTVAAVLKQIGRSIAVLPQAAFYAYTDDDLGASLRGLQSLCGSTNFSLQQAPAGNLSLRVSGELGDVAGPMAGLEVSARLRKEDAVVVPGVGSTPLACVTVISAAGAPVFFRLQQNGVPVFFCASSHMVDIDQTVGPDFHDVKDHFSSVVPLIMFLKLMFRDVAWRPQELGACLIVDDPPLRQRYGFCDFGSLRDLMQRHGFTTNIAFIPWNWRRTSAAAGDFFRNESDYFSVSIHGCDHINAEFGTTSLEVLRRRATLAQCRMRNHEARTGIHHDPIMVFPQGIFSSACPEVLKRTGFLAAVNTETVPVDPDGARTRIRDAWDVAITAYSGFPIFTRRYPFHGLENFAFDLLLGKPCLIVSHHDFFKDGGAMVIEFVKKLNSLNCSLRWRRLGEVIRRACRRRTTAEGVEEVEMYGNELLIDNPSDEAIYVRIRKRESQADLIAEALCDEKPTRWAVEEDHLVLGERIRPRSEGRLRVVYREQQAVAGEMGRSLRFELAVAARRFLCEFRDDYLSRSRSLTTTAASLKNALSKAV